MACVPPFYCRLKVAIWQPQFSGFRMKMLIYNFSGFSFTWVIHCIFVSTIYRHQLIERIVDLALIPLPDIICGVRMTKIQSREVTLIAVFQQCSWRLLPVLLSYLITLKVVHGIIFVKRQYIWRRKLLFDGLEFIHKLSVDIVFDNKSCSAFQQQPLLSQNADTTA